MATLLQLALACRDVVATAGGMRHYVGASTRAVVVADDIVSTDGREATVRALQGKLKKMLRIGRSAPGVAPSWHDLTSARTLFAATKRLVRRPGMANRRARLNEAATRLYATIERCAYVREDIMGIDPSEDGERTRIHAVGADSFVIECLCGRSELLDIGLSGSSWTCECGTSLTIERGNT